MKNEKEVEGFHFQEIPREEAVNAVIAGDGNYSAIKEKLLETLPSLPPEKAFAFGLPNGKEVPEESRRGLCMSVNATLKKATVPWRVTYSSSKKLFICVPLSIKLPKHSAQPSTYTKRTPENIAKVVGLRKLGKSVAQIKEETGFSIYAIQTMIDESQVVKPKSGPANEKLSINAENIFALAEKTFGVSDFTARDARAYRKAISVVGVKHLGIHPRELESRLGISAGGVSFNANQQNPFGAKEIKLLLRSVKGGA